MNKQTLQDRLSVILEKYPDNTALEYGERQFTYSQLNRISDSIYWRIISTKIPPGNLIAIYTTNRIEFILLMIGIWKAGCTVVPLNHACPSRQTEKELLLVDVRFVFCEKTLEQGISCIIDKMQSPPRVIPIDNSFYMNDNLASSDEPILEYKREDIVFITFKTGPTGDLAAPALTNKGLSHLIDLEIETLGLNNSSRIAQLALPGCGFFLMEVLPALCSGATLCMCSELVGSTDTSVVFMFAGLGSQYVDMGLDLYRSEPFFRKEMDYCLDILESLTDYNIKELLYPSLDEKKSNRFTSEELNRIEVAQAVIFSVEYALAKLLMNWGIIPHAMIGYSFGEYAAACLAGVISLEDALKVIVGRGELLRGLPDGVMTSVPLIKDQLLPLLEVEGRDLSIAIDNGPSCIVAGSETAVSRFETELKERKLMSMRLKSTRAVHSAMMEPVLEKFEKIVRGISLNKPHLPFISNVTGNWITDAEAVDPNYWVKQLRETVRFADGLNKLLEGPDSIFVEIGPGGDLSALTRYFTNGKNGHKTIMTIRNPRKEIPDMDFLLNCISRFEQWKISGDRPLDDGGLSRWVDQKHIGCLICTPDIFHRIAGETICSDNFRCLTHILLYGGDIIPERLETWYCTFGSRTQLINGYGAAETTMVKSLYSIQPGDEKQEVVPIGKPVRGARLIILNKSLNICGNGITGEIYIRTPYRAEYYNDPALYRERFIPNPFGQDPTDIIFKTGDMGKLLPDGNIVIMEAIRRQSGGVRKITSSVEYVPPGNQIEEKLAAMWCEILKKERVGIMDDFFESGGHSLGIMTLAAEIYKAFNVEMTVLQLFNKPRIKDISDYISGSSGPSSPNSNIEGPFVVFNEHNAVTLFLFPPRIAYGLDYKALSLFLPRYTLYAFNYLEGDSLEEYISIINNIQPRGPYIFLGYSAGGNLAFEVAGGIERGGGTVSHLIFLDAFENREAAGEDTQDNYTRFIETRMNTLGLSFLKERVLEKMQKYARFLNGMEHREILKAKIHLITAADRKIDSDWNLSSVGGFERYQGYGRHIEMLNPGFLEKNAAIIENILLKSVT